MKNSSLHIIALALGLTSMAISCKEIGPKVGSGGTKSLDTTYMTSVPGSKDVRKVVIEEYTGAKCTNCPFGHEIVASLKASNPGRVIGIAYHKFGSPLDEPAHLTNPPTPGYDSVKDDFRRHEATDIMNAVFGYFGNIPLASVDRVFEGTTTLFDRGKWAGRTNTQLASTSGLNLSATLQLAGDGKTGELKVKGIYTSTITQKQVLNVMLLESDLEAPQKYPDSTSEHYVHHHVFRKAYTPASGKPIVADVAPIEPGRAFESTFQLSFEPLWKLENCEIVVFVSNNDQENKQIQQATSLKVKP